MEAPYVCTYLYTSIYTYIYIYTYYIHTYIFPTIFSEALTKTEALQLEPQAVNLRPEAY